MLSFGTHPERPWALSEADSEPIIRRAVEGGVTFFDTADAYNGGMSEVITGRVLSSLLSREELVIATKVNGPTMPGENGRGLSRKHVLASIDASLQRLGMDYVDLYQIHRWDPTTPIAETMDVLHDVVTGARPATSGRAACSPGSSRKPRLQPIGTARPGSSRCRTTTTSSTAKRSARCSRSASTRASPSCPGAHSHAAGSQALAPARAGA
jgi:hypothetical protein